MHQEIINRLNNIQNEPKIELNEKHIEFILKNWIEMHCKHQVTDIKIFDWPVTYSSITISKTKIVQH